MKLKWNWLYIKQNYPNAYEKLISTEELFEEQDFLIDILDHPFDYKNLRHFFVKLGVFFSLKPHEKKNLFSQKNRLHWDVFLYKIENEKILYQEKLSFDENFSYEYVEIKAILECFRIIEYV